MDPVFPYHRERVRPPEAEAVSLSRMGDKDKLPVAPRAAASRLTRHMPRIGTDASDSDASVVALDNGVRIVVFRLPQLATAAVSVFVRSGSQHESARQNGISHVIEHMAFKGTRTRDCQRINLDAERLGADVNAHTDKDHTAFHMRGHARDAGAFVGMLGDIVRESTFPDAELERERGVILHEYADDEDDAMSTAFKLFDKACYGAHPAGRPVIGTRANLRRFTRDELVAWVAQQYTGVNTVVGVAGNVDPDRVAASVRAAFGDMPRGSANLVARPRFVGGIRSRRLTGSGQAHVVVGFPIPPLPEEHAAFVVAAALLGEGMSSPLLDRVRERRGLVYHADCWTDVRDAYGQFVVEASVGRGHLHEYANEVARLLREHVEATDRIGLERARNQVEGRSLFAQEAPEKRLEAAALDLFALGRVRSRDEVLASVNAVGSAQVREAFARMLGAGSAVGLAGRIAKADVEHVARLAGRQGS
jgi:predicted Zn-dependent peptidase